MHHPDPAQTRAFIQRWAQSELNEKAVAQSHFAQLCNLLGVPAPADNPATQHIYRFEKPLAKTGGGGGFADVWYKDRFAWEYKTKGKYPDLRAAYQQLQMYKEDLDNPPVLIACDIAQYEVHVVFTGYQTRVEKFGNEDLENASTRELLYYAFTDPERLRPVEKAETVTEKAAQRFAEVARLLEGRGKTPEEIAPFFMKVLFALFAEDIHILPNELMTQAIRGTVLKPAEFPKLAGTLFHAMRLGEYFGMDKIPHFDGWLYNDDNVLPLNADELQYLSEAAKLDWKDIEPSIFGTLFERSIDPRKRAQLGSHYTSKADILKIVEPVLMAPLRRRWAEVQAEIDMLRPAWEAASGLQEKQSRHKIEGMLFDFLGHLAQVRVLDPACGSGNFLYVALKQLKDLEKEVWTYATGLGLDAPPLGVTPAQFLGIEKDPFAAELAQVTVWIGYLQWLRGNGFADPPEPILQALGTIECRDAVLDFDAQGKPIEPPWPEAEVIIGNPPFLGDKKMRGELGHTYVEQLRAFYGGRVLGGADLVTYWFERTRAQIEQGKLKRAGLLATNSIRGGANRKVLERIKQSGDIFMAWSDREWILDGAAVRVSMIGFDDGGEAERELEGIPVQEIYANLSGAIDSTAACKLEENRGIAYMGTFKIGAFDISEEVARKMLNAPINVNGPPNSDVVRPWINGSDVTRRPRNMWIIDFGTRSEEEAALYEAPFEHVKTHVKPERDTNRRPRRRKYWWQHGETSPGLYTAMQSIGRYIATPTVAKHRLFVWLESSTIPDHQLYIFARDDDYFFGVLHSKPHELWSLRMGTSLEDRPRYTPTSTFETYPFPWPPGQEPHDDARVQAIAAAAKDLVAQRDAWLNPTEFMGVDLKKRTLTNLYNQRPDWLTEAHQRLDAAVLDAYGWPHDISDEEILERLLALNLARAGGGASGGSRGGERGVA
jgi:type II restriction/modification system DNA methylase subunit YeeA